MKKYLIFIALVAGCGGASTGDQSKVVSLNTSTSDSSTPATPSTSVIGSCTVQEVTEGVKITCGENTYTIENGTDGVAGAVGATGLPGAVGATGLQGPQGEPGPESEVHLHDSNGQDLGILVGVNPYKTYLKDLDVVVGFKSYSLRDSNVAKRGTVEVASDGGRFYFRNQTCTGQLYLEALVLTNDFWGFKEVYPMNSVIGGYYRIVPGSQLVDLNFNSISELDSDGCDSFSSSSLVEPFYPIEAITLPFSEPLGWPLRIVF